MKTTCDTCNSRYAIPDEKVIGKVLQVRCKNCDNVMVVVGPTHHFDGDVEKRPPTLTGFIAADRPSAVTIRPPKKKPAWWAAINNKPHGPYTEEDILELVELGDVYARTRMWRKGMDGWERICESPSLAWAYDAVIQRVAEDEDFLRDREASGILAHAALVTDGSGYFPNPTLKSGWLILDEKTQSYLETVARANGLFQEPKPQPQPGAWATFAAMGFGMAAAAMGVFMLVQSGV